MEAEIYMTIKSLLSVFVYLFRYVEIVKSFSSDNALSFKDANKILQQFEKKIIEDQELQDFTSNQCVTWTFIIEHSP